MTDNTARVASIITRALWIAGSFAALNPENITDRVAVWSINTITTLNFPDTFVSLSLDTKSVN